MNLQTNIHAWEESKEIVARLVKENILNKLDSYLKKFDKEDTKIIVDIKIEKNKKELFNWKLQITINSVKNPFVYEREDYKKLDDLVNNLFEHFKEELAKK